MNPVLLLIPGLLNTPAVFDRTRALLAPSLEVRVVNVQTQSSIAAMAADAWAAVADLPAEQPLVMGGFSMGGYVALQMLAQPQRTVQGLALICSSARPDTEEGQVLRERAINAMERDFERYVSKLASFLVTPTEPADPALMAHLRQDMLAVGGAAAIRQHRAVALREDRRPLLATLNLATHVVAAAQDPVLPLAHSQELAAGIGHAQLSVVQGVGHMLPLERPAELAAALSELMARVAAKGSV